jgi:hypothetical protein
MIRSEYCILYNTTEQSTGYDKIANILVRRCNVTTAGPGYLEVD